MIDKKVFLPLFCLLLSCSVFSQSRIGLGFEGYYQPPGFLSYSANDIAANKSSFAPNFHISYGYQIKRSSLILRANYDVFDAHIEGIDFRNENNEHIGSLESKIQRMLSFDLLFNYRFFDADLIYFEIAAGPSVILPIEDYMVFKLPDGSTEKWDYDATDNTHPIGFSVLPTYSFRFNPRQIGGTKYGLTAGVPFRMYWLDNSSINPHYLIGLNLGLFLHLN